jgi:hypothetical protein
MSTVKSQILSKVATLLDKFSDRLVKVTRETRQNTDAVAGLLKERTGTANTIQEITIRIQRDFERWSVLLKRHAALTLSVNGLRDEVVALQVLNGRVRELELKLADGESQLDLESRIESNKVFMLRTAEENDKREAAQTLRDQNNVQSLVNLRDSTTQAFSQVQKDVEELLKSIGKLSNRVYRVEKQYDDLLERAKSVVVSNFNKPSAIDQQLVNSKLSGVYDVTANLEERLQKLETAHTEWKRQAAKEAVEFIRKLSPEEIRKANP